ncbi:MAG TPA: ATP-binding cassette domain-containing protein, partial [Gammaproteobacteria bacterium]|nr:ATP-binding cassette domain-containing protein [Gammaproteobacteria bacterium]
MPGQSLIEISGLVNRFDSNIVHDHLDLNIDRGEVLAIIGGSGSGKTTLLRSILMLHQPNAGKIKVFDVDVLNCSPRQAEKVQRRWGVAFQNNALFSSLTVLENIMFPLKEFTDLSFELRRELALLKILLVGLKAEVSELYPSELSGGMLKRAALARAMALDPEVLFLDEPTAGLDPNSAGALDELIIHMRDDLGLTIVVVTHDLDTLWRVPDRVAFLGEG